MKKLLLIFFLLPIYLTAQEEFSFQIYFEDALGNRDTVTIGYDDNATHAIETAFGEEDIKSLPWNNQCEVRITDFSKTFHTKKQIIKNHCGKYWNLLEPIFIDIKNPQFPLTISWDYFVLQGECIRGSILSNTIGAQLPGDNMLPPPMRHSNMAYFNSIPQNSHFLHYDDGDNLPVYRFYLLIRDSTSLTLGTDILENNKTDVYPNPFNSEFTVSSNLPLCDIYVTDLLGNKIDFEIQNNTISLSNDEAKGVYILSFFQAGKRYFYKMMKQ